MVGPCPKRERCEDVFLLPLSRGEAATAHFPEENRQTRRACSGTLEKSCCKPPSPQGGVLMTSLSVPLMYGWGNWPVPYQALCDCLLALGEVRGRFFLCGRGIERLVDLRRQRGCRSPALQH